MVSSIAVVGRDGEITIPAELRRALLIKEGDRVRLELENGHLRVEPYGGVNERTAGDIEHHGQVLTAEELREAAEIAIAESALERSGA